MKDGLENELSCHTLLTRKELVRSIERQERFPFSLED